MAQPKQFKDLTIFKNSRHTRKNKSNPFNFISKDNWTNAQFKAEAAELYFKEYPTIMDYISNCRWAFVDETIEDIATFRLWLSGEIPDNYYDEAQSYYDFWRNDYLKIKKCYKMGINPYID